MVILNETKGHESIISKLEKAQTTQHLASTHIFVGPAGIGKKRVALGMAQNLLCESREGRACGRCGSCIRVEKQQHESLLLTLPEKNQIKIDQARAILKFGHFKSLHTSSVVIIDDVELMNPQAANSLLKILEEPHQKLFFFLICNSLGRVLTTIRSRSQIWHFQPLSKNVIKELNPSYPEWILDASQGSLGAAELLTNRDNEDLRPHVFHWLKSFSTESKEKVLQEGRDLIVSKDQVLTIASLWQQMVRDAIVYKFRPEKIIHQDLAKEVSTLSIYSFEQLSKLFNLGQELETSVYRHWDMSLTTDYLIHETHKCLRGIS
ncbi:MAG: DNA polymerase III subunit [Bdellovibrionales bacterium]|nr:DNA polymerase III subunit [Bdellovibrionales bacterium]